MKNKESESETANDMGVQARNSRSSRGFDGADSDNNPVFTNEAASSYLTSDIQVLNSHGPRTNFLAGRG